MVLLLLHLWVAYVISTSAGGMAPPPGSGGPLTGGRGLPAGSGGPTAAAWEASTSCSELAGHFGVNWTQFPGDVAHGVHSLSVDDLRYFIDPAAATNIPTANRNLTGPPVLRYAPCIPSEFEFPAGQILDYLETNNQAGIETDMGRMTLLEKLGHEAHMQEMWYTAGQLYSQLATRPLDTRLVCPCLVDDEVTGVLEMLEVASTKLSRFDPYKFVDNFRIDGIEPESIKALLPQLRESSAYWQYYKTYLIDLASSEQKMFHLALYLLCKTKTVM